VGNEERYSDTPAKIRLAEEFDPRILPAPSAERWTASEKLPPFAHSARVFFVQSVRLAPLTQTRSENRIAMPPPSPDRRSPPAWLLRREDQSALGIIVLVCLAAVIGWWGCQGGWHGRLIEVGHAPPRTARFQVDINQADWPELTQLPGVGRTLAERIIEHRRKNGPFRNHEELRRVYGIGPKKLESLRPYLSPIRASPATAPEH